MRRWSRLGPIGLIAFAAVWGCSASIPVATPRPLPDDLPTPPGSYVLTAEMKYGVPPLDITFTVPSDGWISWGPGVLTNDVNDRDHVGLGFSNIANLWRDPCEWSTSGALQPPVGSAVSDLANALARLPHVIASAPTATTIGGFDGMSMTTTIDPDLDLDDCDSFEVRTWINTGGDSPYYMSPGRVEQFWILDVDGTRLVIEGIYFPDAPQANLADLRTIVESIDIETGSSGS